MNTKAIVFFMNTKATVILRERTDFSRENSELKITLQGAISRVNLSVKKRRRAYPERRPAPKNYMWLLVRSLAVLTSINESPRRKIELTLPTMSILTNV